MKETSKKEVAAEEKRDLNKERELRCVPVIREIVAKICSSELPVGIGKADEKDIGKFDDVTKFALGKMLEANLLIDDVTYVGFGVQQPFDLVCSLLRSYSNIEDEFSKEEKPSEKAPAPLAKAVMDALVIVGLGEVPVGNLNEIEGAKDKYRELALLIRSLLLEHKIERRNYEMFAEYLMNVPKRVVERVNHALTLTLEQAVRKQWGKDHTEVTLLELDTFLKK